MMRSVVALTIGGRRNIHRSSAMELPLQDSRKSMKGMITRCTNGTPPTVVCIADLAYYPLFLCYLCGEDPLLDPRSISVSLSLLSGRSPSRPPVGRLRPGLGRLCAARE